jgi:formylglycine-generating enzyme required for sulfatase activity
MQKLHSPGAYPKDALARSGRLTENTHRMLTKLRLSVLSSAALAVCSINAKAALLIEWVSVGDTGNAADITGKPSPVGSVAQVFQIMKYEFTNALYAQFLNAVDPDGTNPNKIYNANMGSTARGGISFNGGNAAGSKYSVKTNMTAKPVNYVCWWDGARVSNWLQAGALNYSATDASELAPQNNGAYTVGVLDNGPAVGKNAGATIYLPSQDQWYKAAYYKSGGTNADYWDYATQSNTRPTAVTADSIGNGSAGNTGNFVNAENTADWNGQDGNVTTVGTNGGSSAYGTFDMGGSVWEWNDLNGEAGGTRELRGGELRLSTEQTSSSAQYGVQTFDPSAAEDYWVGFRLAGAAVPEPSSSLLVMLASGMLFFCRRR